MTKRTEILNALVNQEQDLQNRYRNNPDLNVMYQLNQVRSELKTLRAQILVNMPTIGMKRETLKKKVGVL